MKSNILIEQLPTTVTVSGTEYAINYSFRAGILFEIFVFNEKIDDEQKIMNCLNLFYLKDIPQNVEEALKKMLEFYGQDEAERQEEPNDKRGKAPKRQVRAYDFAQDGDYIFSAFLTQYGINLNHIENKELHWLEFLAMLQCLNDNLLFSKIMYWRQVNTSGMAKSEKEFINKMKRKYAIKDPLRPDKKLALSERNRQMKEYVKRRSFEAQEEMKRRNKK